TGHSWLLLPLQASVRLFQDEANPVQARVQGPVGDGANQGSIEAFLSIQAEAGRWKRGEVKGKLQGAPMELANPLLRRFLPGTDLSGLMHAQGLVTWEMDGGVLTALAAEGEVGGKTCTFTVPGLADRLVLDQFRAPCKLRYDGKFLDVARAELSC